MDDDTVNKTMMLRVRLSAALNEFMRASQRLNIVSCQMVLDGRVEEGLLLCEKGIARLEGAAMAIQRTINDNQ